MNQNQLSQNGLNRMMLSRLVGAILALLIMFFLPAGTFVYWEAWMYLIVIFVPLSFVVLYLRKNNPDLLVRRMKMKEKEAEQKLIVKLSFIPFSLAFILPGLDQRFGWSTVPVWAVILAEIIVLLGYGLVFLVFRENTYASRVIEVEQGQTVIQSGPYALVRHPMYLGSLMMFIFSPLALGSYWAILPGLLTIPVLVARIINEESVLVRDLKGYPEYMKKTRNRLVPGVW
jgi:protein-S-isoprenylcysteine O-methyltransferase Ste14